MLLLLVNLDDRGPLDEYDDRVANGRLRDDEHQRGRCFEKFSMRPLLTFLKALFRAFSICMTSLENTKPHQLFILLSVL